MPRTKKEKDVLDDMFEKGEDSNEETNQSDEEIEKTSDIDPNKEYVLYEKRNDTHTVVRSRREVTPVTCRECGYDVAIDNGTVYSECNDAEKAVMERALKKHTENFHSNFQKRIIKGSEFPKQYLQKVRI